MEPINQTNQNFMQTNEAHQTITKKTATVEVLKHLQTTKQIGIAGILGCLLSAMLTVSFNPMVGTGAAAVFSGFLGFMTVRIMNEEKRLRIKYVLP